MTIDNSWFAQWFNDTPYMAILRGFGWPRTLEVARAAWDAGVQLAEVPVQSPDDLLVLQQLVQFGAEHGRPVGAGTVLTPDQVDAVAAAGARFIVSPDTNPDVIRRADQLGLASLPGVGSATDVAVCLRLGLTWLKAFPAVSLGSTWIKQMHGPFPQAQFVATGGMDLRNAGEFLSAGASAVSLGSAVEQLGRLDAPPAG